MAPGCGELKSFGNTSSPSNYKKSPKLLPVCHSLAGKSHTLTWEPQTWPARLCSRNHPPALELHRPLGRSWKAPWLAPALAVAASPPLPAASSPHTPVVHLENKAEESQTTARYLQSNWCQLHPEAEQAYQHIIKNRAQSRQCLPDGKVQLLQSCLAVWITAQLVLPEGHHHVTPPLKKSARSPKRGWRIKLASEVTKSVL